MATPQSQSLAGLVEVDPGHRWFVASRAFNVGGWWDVTYQLEPYGDAGRSRWEMRCTCPHGARQASCPLDERRPCAHMTEVLRFQSAKYRRPVAPVNVSALVD